MNEAQRAHDARTSHEEMIDAKVREAHRMHVWARAYAAVIGIQTNNPDSSINADAKMARIVADEAVVQFNEAWARR